MQRRYPGNVIGRNGPDPGRRAVGQYHVPCRRAVLEVGVGISNSFFDLETWPVLPPGQESQRHAENCRQAAVYVGQSGRDVSRRVMHVLRSSLHQDLRPAGPIGAGHGRPDATIPGCAVTRSSDPGAALKSSDSPSRAQLTANTTGRAPRDSAKYPSFASRSNVRQRSALRGVGVARSTTVSCIAVRLSAIGRMVAEVNRPRAGPKDPKAPPEDPKGNGLDLCWGSASGADWNPSL